MRKLPCSPSLPHSRRAPGGWWWASLVLAVACEGPAGPQGLIGPKGDPGDDGTAGNNGTNGPAGPTGATGATGTPGASGMNAHLSGPGLRLTISSVTLNASRAPVVDFTITDEAGIPLDRTGMATEGAVTLRFYAAVLGRPLSADGGVLPDAGVGSYTALTTRTVPGPGQGQQTIQGAPDQGGTFALQDAATGRYTYTFATTLPPTDALSTHTIGGDGSRFFEGLRYVAAATKDFLPGGGNPTEIREIVTTAACNRCHSPLRAHGGDRRDVGQCVLCHTASARDNNTGNSLEMVDMIHRIHMGEHLPTVMDGGMGFFSVDDDGGMHDFSETRFPQELGRCATCHTGAQGDVWKTRPTRNACTSCHNTTSFVTPAPAGMRAHPGGAQANDDSCRVCHPVSGSLAGMEDKHLPPSLQPGAPQPSLEIMEVRNTAPGQAPIVRFKAKLGANGTNLSTSPWAWLAVTVAGPTSDYADAWQAVVQGTGAEGSLVVIDGTAGIHEYTLPGAKGIPAPATGSYALGLEGALQPVPNGPVYSAQNPVTYFAVTGGAVLPRRDVVDATKCNACHERVPGHGGVRSNPEYCAMCHHANQTDADGVARLEQSTVVSHSLQLKVLVHKIHAGKMVMGDPDVPPTRGAPQGATLSWAGVRFPSALSDCQRCHVPGATDLPLTDSALPTLTEVLQCTEAPANDGDNYCDTRIVSETRLTPPATAACMACHDSPQSAAHAQIMTTSTGVESCATCHGPRAQFSVNWAHRQEP